MCKNFTRGMMQKEILLYGCAAGGRAPVIDTGASEEVGRCQPRGALREELSRRCLDAQACAWQIWMDWGLAAGIQKAR